MSDLELSIVIACYNETSRIPKTLEDIAKFAAENPQIRFEVIAVSDGSKDNTADVLQEYSKKYDWLKVISYAKNRGKGYAVKTGMLATQGRYAIFMDADNSTNIREYLHFKPLVNDFDVIIGSRYLNDSNLIVHPGLSRIVISRLSNFLVRLVLGINFHDTQCGFKLFKHANIQDVFGRQQIERFGFDMEIIIIAKRLGLKIKEQPVTWVDDPNSTVDPIKDTIRTFKELLQIKRNLLARKYQ